MSRRIAQVSQHLNPLSLEASQQPKSSGKELFFSSFSIWVLVNLPYVKDTLALMLYPSG